MSRRIRMSAVLGRPSRVLVLWAMVALMATGIAQAQAADPSPPSAGPSTSAGSPAPSAGPSTSAPVDILFVQTWATSRIEPADAGEVLVRMSRASGQTMYVADDGERRVGTIGSVAFLERLTASLGVPPYAGVLGQRPDGSQVLLVGEVLEGGQADRQTFEYRLRLVPDEVDIDLEVDAERIDALTEPLDLQLSYILFTGVQGCSPWDPACDVSG